MKPNDRNGSDPCMFTRASFLQLLTVALESQSYRFVRQAALNWLAVFPGDLAVQVALGKAHLAEGRVAQAVSVLERVCRFDPEFLEAQEKLTQTYDHAGAALASVARASALLLGSQLLEGGPVPEWYGRHLAARLALSSGNLEEAETYLHQVLSLAPEHPLAAIDHLNVSIRYQDRAVVYQIAGDYHSKWPDCLQFSLRLAELEMEFGNESKAVGLLHHCVANDAAGQVVNRLWGNDHRYQPLWPAGLEIFLDLPIPAEVAFQMGWNRLPTGELLVPAAATPEIQVEPAVNPTPMVTAPNAAFSAQILNPSQPAPVVPPGKDEVIRTVEETFTRLAKQMKKPGLGRADGRYPVYVILSTLKGLDNQYGPQTRNVLVKVMNQIVENVSHRSGWNAMIFMPDDIEAVNKLGVKPVDALDPWKLKLAIADLDQALAKKGQMIGAILIAGGPEVVPFHNLPNPTYDSDKEIPSDNPYATLDSNYFIPEWPVGRLPGAAGKDAGLLLEQLRSVNRSHAKKAKLMPQFGGILLWIIEFLRQMASNRSLKSFGYTAAVWKDSSSQVVRAMGDQGTFLVCPPVAAQLVSTEQLLNSPLEYFNLHGLPDAAEWYGQKEGGETSTEPDYPVALSPKNLQKNGKSPQVVFSEACYGANILQKTEDQSIALKFLSIGCKAFVGSTVIAYGSVTTPLIGADLLGSTFWKNLREGLTAGEALLQAKVAVVQEMNQRQGFLDGEDQKTLISFLLLGDPLAGYEAFKTRAKSTLRFKSHPKVKTICDRQIQHDAAPEVSVAVLKEVKGIVARYLPGLVDGDIQVNELYEVIDANGPDSGFTSKLNNSEKSARMVFTVSKSVNVARRTFRQYARVTLNAKGKLVKLAVSR